MIQSHFCDTQMCCQNIAACSKINEELSPLSVYDINDSEVPIRGNTAKYRDLLQCGVTTAHKVTWHKEGQALGWENTSFLPNTFSFQDQDLGIALFTQEFHLGHK